MSWTPYQSDNKVPKVLYPWQSSNSEFGPVVETTNVSDEHQNNLDIPIAIQKGLKSYTQHPIVNCVEFLERSTVLWVSDWSFTVIEEMKH